MLGERILRVLEQYPDPVVALTVFDMFRAKMVRADPYPLSYLKGTLKPDKLGLSLDQIEVVYKWYRRAMQRRRRVGGYTPVSEEAMDGLPFFKTYIDQVGFYGVAEGVDIARKTLKKNIENTIEREEYGFASEDEMQALIPWVARIVAAFVKAQRKISPDKLRALIDRVGGYENLPSSGYAPELEKVMDWWVLAVEEAYATAQAVTHMSAYLTEITDWFVATRPNIMSMSVQEVLNAQREWHLEEDERRQREEAAANVERQRRLRAEAKAPIFVYGQYNFYKLDQEDELIDEGLCQNHCVASYWRKVQSNETQIFSMRVSFDKRVATIEVNKFVFQPLKWSVMQTNYEVMQVRGRFNAAITKAAEREAIGAFFAAQGFISRDFEQEIKAAKRAGPQNLSGLLYGHTGVHKMLSGFGRRR